MHNRVFATDDLVEMIWNGSIIWEGPITGGSQDPDTGVYTPGTRTRVYEGLASVQEIRDEQKRGVSGGIVMDGDAKIYVSAKMPTGGKPGDRITATYVAGGTEITRTGEISDVNFTSRRILVRWHETSPARP